MNSKTIALIVCAISGLASVSVLGDAIKLESYDMALIMLVNIGFLLYVAYRIDTDQL